MEIYVVVFEDVVNQKNRVAVAFTDRKEANKFVGQAKSNPYLKYIGQTGFKVEPTNLFDTVEELNEWTEEKSKKTK